MHLFGRGLPNADIKMICSLFLCISLQFYNSPPTFSSRFDELRGDFCFSKNFFKNTPPRFLSHFKQVKGLLIFFSKYPHFFASRFKQVKGYKNFLEIGRIWVCISAPFVQMSERRFYDGKVIKEIETGMGIIHQSQNRQKNIQRFVP